MEHNGREEGLPDYPKKGEPTQVKATRLMISMGVRTSSLNVISIKKEKKRRGSPQNKRFFKLGKTLGIIHSNR